MTMVPHDAATEHPGKLCAVQPPRSEPIIELKANVHDVNLMQTIMYIIISVMHRT